MIAPPEEDTGRALIRAFLEAGAQFTPVTAALSRLYETTHPSQFQKDLMAWRTEISNVANRHDARLEALEAAHHPRIKLTGEAQGLAQWLARHSEEGLERFVDADEAQAAFPEWRSRDLQDAAAELKLAGLATTSATLGSPLRMITPTAELFALFDPLVVGTSPQADAVSLARAILERDPDYAATADLAEHLGWSPRRMNPALALLVTLVPPGQVSRTLQPTWVTSGFIVSAEARVRLKQLVNSSSA